MSVEERFIELLQNAVEKVKTEEDPVELNQFKKLFKRNVPFALRSYVAAYLAKNAVSGGRRDSYRNRRENFRSRRNHFENGSEKNFHTEREPMPRVVIDEALAATIFIGIGRNRRVFPRDLITLIVQNADIDRTRIGDIRVLDNYSFVQLYAEDCDKVISSLDGIEYRGRKLNVSYSKKRPENEESENTSSEQKVETKEEESAQYEAEDRAAYALAEKAAEAASKNGNF